jgi:thiazole synthase ThiGH ThiG subunit
VSLHPIEVVLYKDKLNRDKIEINENARILISREFAVLFFNIL